MSEEENESEGLAELTEAEEGTIEGVLDTFDKQSEKVRVAAFEALLATYCHECGTEQPDDPEEECPCADDDDDDDDEDDEDEDDEDEDEDEDEEEEGA